MSPLVREPVASGGFIGKRILDRCHEAADTLLLDGSTPWEVDEAMVEFGFRLGPYEAQDLAGLDVVYGARRRVGAASGLARRYIPIADRMLAEGRLGKKTAVGWYRYPGGSGKVVDPLIEDLLREEAYFAKVKRRDFTPEEIRQRLLLAMLNEAAEILHQGLTPSASEIDRVTIAELGFPEWRGGLMHYGDALGPANVLAALIRLVGEDHVAWQPSAMIVDCSEQGIGFSQWRPAASGERAPEKTSREPKSGGAALKAMLPRCA